MAEFDRFDEYEKQSSLSTHEAAEHPSNALLNAFDRDGRSGWQHAILEYTRDMVACFDRDYNVLYCNPALNKVALFSDGDSAWPLGKDYMSKESADLVFNQWAPDVFEGAHRSGEIILISKYGTEMPVSIDLFPIYNHQSRAVGMAASMHDITYLRANDSASERLQMSLDLMKAGTWELFVSEKLLYYDDRFQSIMRLPKPPITIDAWANYLSTLIDNDKYGALLDYLLSDIDGPWPSDYKYMRAQFPDGSVTYTCCTSKTLYDAHGKPERLLGVTWDVTSEALEREAREAEQQ